jgi:hypothetical protein
LRGGKRGGGHEVSILIRLGDGEREERAPSNVSTVIAMISIGSGLKTLTSQRCRNNCLSRLDGK